jgi:TupA-like ATPgrasp
LIAEERIGSEAVPASEMRGWVFDGVLQQITRFDVRPRIASNYDRTFARIETSRVLDAPIDKANHFDSVATAEKERLVRLMEVIGAPFDHMRVDIFIDGGQFWFNELSPFPFGGLVYYSNRDFDLLRGSFWKLPDLSASDPNTSDWEALLSETPLGIFQ